MVSQSRLRLSLGDFGGKMPSPKRPWEAKGSPKGCQREDLGVVLGSKSCENCQLVQTVNFVKIELSCTRELNFRGPRRFEYHQNVNLIVFDTWPRLGSCYLGGLKGGKLENCHQKDAKGRILDAFLGPKDGTL